MGFWEILVVAIVGLVVVGPERLPEALRSGMLWFGRVKRAINNTKAEFEQQLGVDDIRRELHNEQVLKSLKALEEAQREAEREIHSMSDEMKAQVKKIEDSIDEPVPHDNDPNDPSINGLDDAPLPAASATDISDYQSSASTHAQSTAKTDAKNN